MRTLVVAAILIVFPLLPLFCPAQTQPRTVWSQPEAGVRTSAALAQPPEAGRSLQITITLDQSNATPVDLNGAFVWLFLTQSKDVGYISAKIPLADLAQKPPAELATGTPVTLKVDLSTVAAIPYRADMTVSNGYVDIPSTSVSPGNLAKVLPLGRSRARLMTYIPAKKALINGNNIEIFTLDPSVQALTSNRERAELLAMFMHDEFAAKTARDRAVKIGREVTPDLLALFTAKDIARPAFADMWLAAAFIDLSDPRAVDAMVAALKQNTPAANVIAFHGHKLTGPAFKPLFAAIEAAAAKDPVTAAWAARGSQDFAHKPRPDLVDAVIAALANAEGKARAPLVEALEKLTRQKLGDDPAAWATWWRAHRQDFK